MKKSELKNIIRESIKQLMTEQSTQYTPGQAGVIIQAKTCTGQLGSIMGGVCHPEVNTQVGDTFYGDASALPAGNYRNWMVNTVGGSCIWDTPSGPNSIWPVQIQAGSINNIGNCPNCCSSVGWNYGGITPSGHCHNVCSQVPGCTDPTATNYDPLATVDDGSCILPLPPCSDPQNQCNVSQWGGIMNWYNTWSNSGPFNNQTNVNQPCAHICNKITDWTNNCQNAGPVQANQLACKLMIGGYAWSQNQCFQSNAQACQGVSNPI